ncbi:MAG: hypothetical protein U1F81_24165 [Verrucomicrobiaceae bacterium]
MPMNANARSKNSPRSEYTLLFRGSATEKVSSTRLTDRELYPLACRWNDIVGNRQRLGSEAVGKIRQDAVEDFKRLVLGSQAKLEEIATWEVVEVEIPWLGERIGWAARVFPWEDAIAMATKPLRDKRRVTVIRHLHCEKAVKTCVPDPAALKLLLIASGPGAVKDVYDFTDECSRVKAMLGVTKERLQQPANSTLAEIKAIMEQQKPDVVHLTGMDLHQARENEVIPVSSTREGDRDGFLLAAPRDVAPSYHEATAEEMAGALVPSTKSAPLLIGMNFYHSAARTAALCVANGATHVLAFQDSADDTQAEAFFARFYSHWRRGRLKNPLGAFQQAVNVFRGSRERGAGVVLWSRRSLFETMEAETEREIEPVVEAVTPQAIREAVGLRIVPPRQVNYSMLHNEQPLMSQFVVSLTSGGEPPPVEVCVTLNAGTADFPWRHTLRLTMEEPVHDLRDKIRASLIPDLLRSCRESLWSSLHVRVTCGSEVLHEETNAVELLSADEWRNTDEDRRWLPSFCFPRDAAVEKVMRSAQLLLKVITDQSDAAFDGYQIFDRGDKNKACREWVDMQVRAIWAAIQHLHPLAYINPPPSYDPLGQRIRTPTQMYEAGAGTCIDLSMLFSACLENICLYPVVFLIDGHAFSGYWRDPGQWETLSSFATSTVEDETPDMKNAMETSVLTPRQTGAGWMLGKAFLPRIRRHLRDGDLVAVEAVPVTSAGDLSTSMEAGAENLADAGAFISLVDLQIARTVDHPVTPLPLANPSFHSRS